MRILGITFYKKEKARRFRSIGTMETPALQKGNYHLKKLVPDMNLNKQMLQSMPEPMLTHVYWSNNKKPASSRN